MFAVVVMFKVKPEASKDFMALILKNAKKSLDEEVSCHQFDVCSLPENPTDVFLYELYSNREAFDVHLASDHFLDFSRATENMVTAKELRLYPKVVQY